MDDRPNPTQIDAPMPVIACGVRRAVILGADGNLTTMAVTAATAISRQTPILCHAVSVARRLGLDRFPARDILELFAFVRPAAPCIPTAGGIATALGMARPAGLEEEVRCLSRAATLLLAELAGKEKEHRRDGRIHAIARTMARAGWPWGTAVVAALANSEPAARRGVPGGIHGGLDVWTDLREWVEQAPEPAPANHPVAPAEARERLAQLVGDDAEPRPQQSDYASAVTAAFTPREAAGEPNLVIAEAGTGVGKTLGYIAPASLWAEKNQGAVWISTFTRNLQRQIDGELDRLYPDPKQKARRVVIRKGRENYLCLLNLEDAVGSAATRQGAAVALGLMARWAAHTRDGDLVGGDFPTWLADLVGWRDTLGLTDRRGECIYAACSHYHRCFVERTVRHARRADLVVANHALVMTQAALGGLDDASVPTRLVFDEGHHVFGAADSAFSAELGGRAGAELRRWLLGAERGARRARGLGRRMEDLALMDGATGERLAQVLAAARALPGPGWLQRIEAGRTEGPAEAFLARVRDQVYARTADARSPYGLETETAPPVDGLVAAAQALAAALADLAAPMKALVARLAAYMDEAAADMDTALRQRLEAVSRGLTRRAEGEVDAWCAMLRTLESETPPQFIDWLSVSRERGNDADFAMHRHWIDPTLPFAEQVAAPAHGILITSATMRDGTGDMEADWRAAEAITGAAHMARPARRAAVPSPFDYAAQTRVLVVTDVDRNDTAQVAAAYRTLFMAGGGGALGLFTAISRLRAVHERIAPALEEAGLRLLAQHVDTLDTASLIDIFRAEDDSCILGTDAIRDGVDVPGRALRLVVFDRVPWPRPTILHKARRKAFAATDFDDRLTRLRLKQAYGRLIRRADDRGAFVMLDRRMPSRLAAAFPATVELTRTGLADAVAEVRAFLGEDAAG